MVDECLAVVSELDENVDYIETGSVGYTLPNKKYHIFAYIDEIDGENVIVLEPNKVVGGAHEPIFRDTFIVSLGDVENIRKGIDWCLEQFAADRYGIDAVLNRATKRSEQFNGKETIDKDLEMG